MTQVLGFTRCSFTLQDMSDMLWLHRNTEWNLVWVIVWVGSSYLGLQLGRPNPTQTTGPQTWPNPTRSRPGSTWKPKAQLPGLGKIQLWNQSEVPITGILSSVASGKCFRVYLLLSVRFYFIFLLCLIFSTGLLFIFIFSFFLACILPGFPGMPHICRAGIDSRNGGRTERNRWIQTGSKFHQQLTALNNQVHWEHSSPVFSAALRFRGARSLPESGMVGKHSERSTAYPALMRSCTNRQSVGGERSQGKSQLDSGWGMLTMLRSSG